jgi:hypothetical protein
MSSPAWYEVEQRMVRGATATGTKWNSEWYEAKTANGTRRNREWHETFLITIRPARTRGSSGAQSRKYAATAAAIPSTESTMKW